MLSEARGRLRRSAGGGLPAHTHNVKFLGHELRHVQREKGGKSELQGANEDEQQR